jgi:CRISPR system Cascade subunit CasE
MMFLSRLVLNIVSTRVLADLANIQALHQSIMLGFGIAPDASQPRDYFDVLMRVEGQAGSSPPTVLVSSSSEPDWTNLPAGYLAFPAEVRSMGTLLGTMRAGLALRFWLVAVPYRYEQRQGFNLNGKPARAHKVNLDRPAEQQAWLRNHLARAGVDLGDHQAVRLSDVRGIRNGGSFAYRGIRFEGTIVVRDPSALRTALESGIGPGKAYGFGLLSVAPV